MYHLPAAQTNHPDSVQKGTQFSRTISLHCHSGLSDTSSTSKDKRAGRGDEKAPEGPRDGEGVCIVGKREEIKDGMEKPTSSLEVALGLLSSQRTYLDVEELEVKLQYNTCTMRD